MNGILPTSWTSRAWLGLWCALVGLLATNLSAGAAPPAEPPSTATNKTSQTKAAKVPATAKLIDFDVSVTPKQARPGQTVKLTITGKPKPGYYTYPLTQRTPDQNEGYLSELKYQETPGL